MLIYIGYIYKTTNLINNIIYIGKHQREEFDNKYYGSGKILQRALNKNGKENFSIEVIDWAETVEALNEKEIKFIAAYDSTNPEIGYNIQSGGEGNTKGSHQSEETKKKKAKALTGKFRSNETKLKMSLAKMGKHPTEATLIKMSEVQKGKKLSIETRQRISKSQKGKIISEDQKKAISLKNKGKKRTEEVKNNMSKIVKSKMTPERLEKMSLSHKGKKWTDKQREAYEKSVLKRKSKAEKGE